MFKARLYSIVFAAAACAIPALAVDGTTLINQSTVMAAGGFPYFISQPGSYKLSGNLVVSGSNPVQIHGITITADNVNLDLNGFTISCSSCVTPFAEGVVVVGKNASISNGTITGFAGSMGGSGIDLGSSGSVDRMTLTNSVYGLLVGSNATGTVLVTNSTLSGNTSAGVDVNVGTVQVSGCILAGNGYGLLSSSAGIVTVLSSTVVGNKTAGLYLSLTGAYGLNTIIGNGTPVALGVSMGNNVCGSGTC